MSRALDAARARRRAAARGRTPYGARDTYEPSAEDRDEVRSLRRDLANPVAVAAALGLLRGRRGVDYLVTGRGRGVTIRCPVHSDKTPSFSIRIAPDCTISAHCYGCGWAGDVLSLVAHVEGLDVRREFPKVLEAARTLARRTPR